MVVWTWSHLQYFVVWWYTLFMFSHKGTWPQILVCISTHLRPATIYDRFWISNHLWVHWPWKHNFYTSGTVWVQTIQLQFVSEVLGQKPYTCRKEFSDFVTFWDSNLTIWNKLEDVKHFHVEEIVPAALVSQYIAGLATYAFLAEAETQNQIFGSALRAFSEFPPIWVRKPYSEPIKYLECAWCHMVLRDTTYSDWSLHITQHLAPELYIGHLEQIRLLSGPQDNLNMDQYICRVCKFPTNSKCKVCCDPVCALKCNQIPRFRKHNLRRSC